MNEIHDALCKSQISNFKSQIPHCSWHLFHLVNSSRLISFSIGN